MTKEWITVVFYQLKTETQQSKRKKITFIYNLILWITTSLLLNMEWKVWPKMSSHSAISLLCLFSPPSYSFSSLRPWTGLSWAPSRTVTPLFHRSIILFAPLQIWVFICPSICLLPLACQVEMTRGDSEERGGKNRERGDLRERRGGKERQSRYLGDDWKLFKTQTRQQTEKERLRNETGGIQSAIKRIIKQRNRRRRQNSEN